MIGQGTCVRQYSVAAWLTIWLKPTRREIGELHLDDRPHALDRRADGRADDGVLADRRIEHAAGKFLREVLSSP